MNNFEVGDLVWHPSLSLAEQDIKNMHGIYFRKSWLDGSPGIYGIVNCADKDSLSVHFIDPIESFRLSDLQLVAKAKQ